MYSQFNNPKIKIKHGIFGVLEELKIHPATYIKIALSEFLFVNQFSVLYFIFEERGENEFFFEEKRFDFLKEIRVALAIFVMLRIFVFFLSRLCYFKDSLIVFVVVVVF